MSSIKVIDINEEAKPEAVKEQPVIEEAKEEVVENNNEIVDTPLTEEVKEEAKEEVKPKAKAKPKASDKVNCKTCDKSMSYKNYRYRHEKICSDEPKPVKPQANPKVNQNQKHNPLFKM